MTNGFIKLQLPAFSQATAVCVCNAAYVQSVAIIWNDDEYLFEGSGENVVMQYLGQDQCQFPASSAASEMTVTFQYDADGNGDYQPSLVGEPVVNDQGWYVVYEVTTEDSSDNDNNDTVFSLMVMKDDPDFPDVTSAAPKASTAGQNLELHAKTYYSNPGGSGDEHYVTVLYDTEENISYAGTSGWKLKSGAWFEERYPVISWVNVFAELVDCPNDGFEDATLTLSTSYWYLLTYPRGSKSVTWTADLADSDYTVTRVTN